MSPLKTDAPLASWISTLCGTAASSLSNASMKAWSAGAVSAAGSNARFCDLTVTTVPEAEPDGAADADAPAEPDGAADLNASVQQSGKAVAFGAGLKFGSRQ